MRPLPALIKRGFSGDARPAVVVGTCDGDTDFAWTIQRDDQGLIRLVAMATTKLSIIEMPPGDADPVAVLLAIEAYLRDEEGDQA